MDEQLYRIVYEHEDGSESQGEIISSRKMWHRLPYKGDKFRLEIIKPVVERTISGADVRRIRTLREDIRNVSSKISNLRFHKKNNDNKLIDADERTLSNLLFTRDDMKQELADLEKQLRL